MEYARKVLPAVFRHLSYLFVAKTKRVTIYFSCHVETTKIKNTSFPFKTVLSEANIKTNRIVATKWTYPKEWGFVSNCFIFLENLFQF